MGHQAQALRELLDAGGVVTAADAYSALTGRIVQHVGFKAAYLGGHSCSAMHYAVPDIGIFSQVEQIEQAARIVHAIDIPLIVDADTLGETVADAFHFTRRYEQAGVAGFHVEDEVNPKHSTFDNGLIPILDMQARIEACVRARRDPAFVIIARCDEIYESGRGRGGTGSFDEALKRGKAYAEAGADLVVYPFATPEQIAEFAATLPVPVCVLGRESPGARLVLSSGWGWQNAARVHFESARRVLQFGHATPVAPVEARDLLLDQPLYDELIADWVAKTGRVQR